MTANPEAHVLQIVGEPAGGIRRHVHAILFGLKEAEGLRQSYVCADAGGDAAFEKELPELEALLGQGLLRLPISKRPGPRDIFNVIRLARFVRERGVTIVHGHGAKGGAYARMLTLLSGVKAVYTPHGGAVHNMFGRLEGAVYTLAEKMLLPLTESFVFESQYSAQAYFRKVGRRPRSWTVNYNGIALAGDVPARPFPGAAETLNIGVFGILRSQKGQIHAVRAAAEIAQARTNTLLHIYGSGPDREPLEAEAERLGITDKVLFHGETAVPLERMREMDIILIPSLFESFGYVAVEAFSLKRPVVATSTGGLPEIISDGVDGLLVQPASSTAAAAAVIRMINDPTLAQRLGGAGYRKLAEKFSLDSMLTNLAAVYEKASAGRA